MDLSTGRSRNRVPGRLPLGAKYVVEGYSGDGGSLRVIARYLVLPDGRRINVPPEQAGKPAQPRGLRLRRGPASNRGRGEGRAEGTGKKFVSRCGTGRWSPR